MRTPQTQRRLLPLGVLIARVGRRFFLSRRQQLHAQAVACARYGNVFSEPFVMLKAISLPRQAQDSHM